MFEQFLDNLAIDNAEQISDRYGEITCSLNKEFRDTDSKTANSLQVGSYGRGTAIKGVSDLDMLYLMPMSSWDKYKDGRQSALWRTSRMRSGDIREQKCGAMVRLLSFLSKIKK